MVDILAAFGLLGINPGLIVMAGGLLAIFAREKVVQAIATIGFPVLALFCLLLGAPAVIGNDGMTATFMGYELILYRVDQLSFVFGLAFTIAACINGIYAFHRRAPLEDSMALLYSGAAICAAFVGDMISLFVFWEITAVASVFLIWGSKTKRAYAAGMRYLGIQVLSGVLLLTGAVYYASQTGSVRIQQMSLDDPGAMFLFIAFGIKAAFPFLHNWLQDAYPKATVTGAVVLSAFTTKLAVYAFARVFPGEQSLIWIGAIMTVFPVFFAVIENDLRKVLAYSLNNQVGFMICAIGVGTPLALNGAAAHAFCHILYKALLFMSMGAVLYRTGTTKATELGGLYKSMPMTAIFCLIGAASISAFPLFSGFAAKSLTMSALGKEGYFIVWCMLLFASAGVLEHSGIKIPYFAFFAHDSGKRPKEAPFNMLLAMGIAAVLCIWLGLPTMLGGAQWLYNILPNQTYAQAYLETDLWTVDHVLTQFQLLVLAAFAFVVLNRLKVYPAEVRSQNLDTDWIYRRPGYSFAKWLGKVWAKAGPGLSTSMGRLYDTVFRQLEAAFSPQGVLSRGPLSGGMAVWTAVLLGFVLALSFLTGS